ncbi:MAG: hypothetical protein ABEJ03_03190 [Candidatus Nanohaloarchaea archaeon]
MSKSYRVTRTIKLSKEIEAESKEEAKEFFSEQDANTLTETEVEVVE